MKINRLDNSDDIGDNWIRINRIKLSEIIKQESKIINSQTQQG